jgi:lysozyme family protein
VPEIKSNLLREAVMKELKSAAHYTAKTTSWEALEPDYEKMLDTVEIRDEWKGRVTQAANRLISNSDRYLTVQTATGVDWELIAAIHEREAGGSFNLDLREGGRIRAATWEADAINALLEQGVVQLFADNPKDNVKEEFAVWIAERWNGFGYRWNGYGPSPYLWSGTNHYTIGKYSSDGHYDPSLVDKQIGFVPLYMDLKGASLSNNVGPAPANNVVANTESCAIENICEYLWNVGKAILGKKS